MSSLANWFQRSPELEIYTDGSSKDGIGSWAFVISRKGKVLSEKSGRMRRANSNAMELQAAIEALKAVPQGSKINLFSDSRILVDAMQTGEGPSAFQGQISALLSLVGNCNIKWHWVKAHSGNKLNERCDELCVAARTI